MVKYSRSTNLVTRSGYGGAVRGVRGLRMRSSGRMGFVLSEARRNVDESADAVAITVGRRCRGRRKHDEDRGQHGLPAHGISTELRSPRPILGLCLKDGTE